MSHYKAYKFQFKPKQMNIRNKKKFSILVEFKPKQMNIRNKKKFFFFFFKPMTESPDFGLYLSITMWAGQMDMIELNSNYFHTYKLFIFMYLLFIENNIKSIKHAKQDIQILKKFCISFTLHKFLFFRQSNIKHNLVRDTIPKQRLPTHKKQDQKEHKKTDTISVSLTTQILTAFYDNVFILEYLLCCVNIPGRLPEILHIKLPKQHQQYAFL
eukprot:TRINITY_DN4451_c0_g1_i8.p1 TRINITY_DN4451_c0_g1~~TRINITY_DN4451_c0_g1_i8.p1  ORF type:complete len:213 (+),score=-4.24 TRINITY_DN4451_c0_g1_i8:365-1003(+)